MFSSDTTDNAIDTLRSDVRLGLSSTQKWLRSRWFYDERGSALFEDITALDEYYPTRSEREVLAREADEIARITQGRTLIELGSGSGEKTRLLLDGLCRFGTLRSFVPVDVSESALSASVNALSLDYPGLIVRGLVGDFTERLDLEKENGPRVIALLGGTIGNFTPDERRRLFRLIHSALQPGEWLLLGTDLVKDPKSLVRAYDDSAGVTAKFNRNVLRVLNTRLGADFQPECFNHEAYWDVSSEWIEMRLRAKQAMLVHIPGAGIDVSFAAGEYLRTEISAKFRPEGVSTELADAGFTLERWWTDSREFFGVSLARSTRT
jgi:L-histidine N-alpha-methyltransferase